MKVYVVQKRTFLPSDGPIGIYHYAMFHGEALRPGAAYLRMEYDYADKLEFPLHVRRNVYSAPSVCQLNGSLLLSRSTAELLSGFEGHHCLSVVYDAVYWKEYEKWRFPKKLYRDSDTVLSELVHRSDVEPPDCVELIVPTVSRHVGECEIVELHCASRDGKRRTLKLPLNFAGLHPIFWSSGTCFREDAYAAIADFIDPDYFEIYTCDL